MNKPSLPWGRLAAEFVVIVIGVLVALGVDQWIDALDDRAREREYTVRLRGDLVADTLRFAGVEQAFELKIAVLRELQAQRTPPSVTDADAMMSRLTVSRMTQIVDLRA